MFCVYILECPEGSKYHYIGYTNNLKRRLKEHDDGLVYTTKSRRPLKLIYYEACLNEYDARKRERYLKTGMGRKFIKNRLKHYSKSISLAWKKTSSTNETLSSQ